MDGVQVSPLTALKARLADRQREFEETQREIGVLQAKSGRLQEIIGELEFSVGLFANGDDGKGKHVGVRAHVGRGKNQRARAPKRDVRHDVLNFLNDRGEKGATVEEIVSALGEPIRERSVKLALDYWRAPAHERVVAADGRWQHLDHARKEVKAEPEPAPANLHRQAGDEPTEAEMAEWTRNLKSLLNGFTHGATLAQLTTRGIPEPAITVAVDTGQIREFTGEGGVRMFVLPQYAATETL